MGGYEMVVKVDGVPIGRVMQLRERWVYRTEDERTEWRGGYSTREMAETELRRLHEDRGREAE